MSLTAAASIGRVGALAIALGIGGAMTAPCMALADDSSSAATTADSSETQASETQTGGTQASGTQASRTPSAATPRPRTDTAPNNRAVRARGDSDVTATQRTAAKRTIVESNRPAPEPDLSRIVDTAPATPAGPAPAGPISNGPASAGPASAAPAVQAQPRPAAAATVASALPSVLTPGPSGKSTGTPARPLDFITAALSLVSREIDRLLFNKTPMANPVLSSQTNPVITGSIGGSDPNGDLLAYTVTQAPTHGTVVVDSSGNFVYTANADLAATGGPDTFAFAVRDTGFHLNFWTPTTISVPVTLNVLVPQPDRQVLAARTASAAATATTPAGNGTVAYSVGDNWGAGFIGKMDVKAGQGGLNTWTVSFTTPAQITNLWNGVVASHIGDTYVVTNAPWNGKLANGQSASFGFQATTGAAGSAVTGLQLNGVANTTPTTTPPGVSVAGVTAAEPSASGTAQAAFTVSLSKASTTPVTIGYATANGTATAGTDYTATTGTLTFAPGVTSQKINVPILADTAVETAETFTVTLSKPTGATIAGATATATITNTAPVVTPPVTPPGVSVTAVTAAEPSATGTAQAAFTVSLSKASTTPVTIGYATANGTATAGTDYTATTGTLTFAPGVTSQKINVPILADTAVETAETFTVTLSKPTGATITTATATATITNTAVTPVTGTGRTYSITATGPDIAGFNPAKDKLNLGDVSVHNFIVVDTPEGVGFRSPWTGETAVIQGVSLGQLTVDSFAPIINDHLRQDLSGALAWERGITAAPNTVYVRSHEVGQVNTVAFNPVTDIVDFRYYGTREQIYLTDSPDGVIIGNAGTGQALILKGVTKSQLTQANFVFHAAQAREDSLYKQLGFASLPDTQIKPQGVPNAGTTVWPTAAGNGTPPTGATGTTTVIAWKNGTNTPLTFDPSKDKLDFGWFTAPEFDVTDTTGSTKITIVGNNQTYTLTGVTLGQLQTGNIIALDSGARTKWQNLIFTATPTTALPSLSVADRSAAEGNTGTSAMNFTVLLSKAAANTVSVGYTTSNDTATAGDFTPTVGTLSFAPGETSKIVSVAISGDATYELNEQFTLNLSNATNATIADAAAIGIITNDDINPSPTTPPKVSIADVAVTEGNGEHSHFMFTATLDKASATTVSVGYATSNGTATAGVDYTAETGTIAFAPGVTTQTVHVGVIGDTAVEPNETFTVTLSAPSGVTIAKATAVGTITNDDVAGTIPPTITPGLSISDASATEPGSGGMAPGFLRTAGNQILDSQGKTVQISGVNWFGMESTTQAPHGLWTRSYKEMINEMAGLGFNTIRLPYSSELLHTTAAPNGIDFSKNADLQGLSGVQVMDAIIAYAGQKGMRVILDHHRSGAGAGTSDNGLWYDSTYTEDAWVADWVTLANRYKTNSTVIGFDLHNEPHNGTWGGGGATDWARAAERAGNAALAVNPNLLMFVEGVGSYQGQNYWWGGNLMGVKDRPIVFNVANRLVYSPHDYPNSVFPQTWFQTADFGAGLPAVFRKAWGYIYEENIAPIYIGEFGTKLVDPKDAIWLEAITSYISGDLDNNGTNDIPAGNQDISWTYWSWNPNSGDTGGILADDWKTVNQNKMAYLTPVQFSAAGGSSLAAFTVSLSSASTSAVTVGYTTSNGTATAGSDYIATSGTLTFAPGETSRTVAIIVNSDATAEAKETFTVTLSNPSGATLIDASGTGSITDPATIPTPPVTPVTPVTPVALPKVSIADLAVTEGNGTHAHFMFTATLDKASATAVSVGYATANGTATAGVDYTAANGTISFAPGVTTQQVHVDILGDTTVESNETFSVTLSNPSGVSIARATAIGSILNDDLAGTTPPTTGANYVDLMTYGMFNGNDHHGMDALVGGRTAITTEAVVAYNDLRRFAGLAPTTIENVGRWAFANSMTNNAQASGNDLQGVGLYYAMQGAKVGWIADAKYDPQIVADIERAARLGSADEVMAMVALYGHTGYAKYLIDNGYQTAFINTLKMEPHWAGWMHDRAHGTLPIEGGAAAHDVNHLTVLSHDQMRPFMNDTWDYPQWPALNVSDKRVIEYYQSMVTLGNPLGDNSTSAGSNSGTVSL